MPDTTLQPGEVRFIQHRVPALKAGGYQLDLQHIVTVPEGPQTYTDDYLFYVSGERFRLDPAEIDSTFPPVDAVGEYFQTLPHLVLNRAMLPWLRSPEFDHQPLPGEDDPRSDVATWLALLVIDEKDTPTPVQARTVAELYAQPGIASYPLPIEKAGQQPGDPCTTIDLDWDLFRRIAPSLEDLKHLATIRVVSGQKPGSDPGAPPGGEYAVLLANRLPQRGHRTTVHLVSLEAMEPYLPGAPEPSPAPQTIRLVSLYHWNFTAEQEPETFGEVIEQLAPTLGLFGPLQIDPNSPPAEQLVLDDQQPDTRAIPIAADDPIQFAMMMGYVALPHRIRDGGLTASWYRGPLVPYPIAQTLLAGGSFRSADAALRFDPATGLFDTSYAAAWQLGRMLTFGNWDVAQRLLRWEHTTSIADVHAGERSVLAQRLQAQPVAAVPSTDALTNRIADLVGQAVQSLAGKTGGTAPAVAAAVADSAPAVPPALPVEVTEWFEALRVLKHVPWNYLVPDESILESERIRFFYIDPNWTDAMIDGAFSLGAATAGDAPPARVARLAAVQARDAAASPIRPATGFLLRSRAVRHWTGIEATAYDAGGNRLTLLRYERLAADVLFGLADGVVARVEFSEPPEALHFGVDLVLPYDESKPPPPIAADSFQKILCNPKSGASLRHNSPPPAVPVTMRNAQVGNALEIGQLAMAMAAQPLPDMPSPFTSAEFALEMVEGVDRVVFSSFDPNRPVIFTS